MLIEAAQELVALSEPGADIPARALRIMELEHETDNVTHRCIGALQKTFITPFDRADIHNLIKALDDIVDAIDEATSRIMLYEIKQMPEEVKALSQVIFQAIRSLREALPMLRKLTPDNEKAIKRACIAVHRFENDGDAILREALVRLFKDGSAPLDVIKWKEIFEHLEAATDRCEDVADIIQGVVIEAS